MAAARVAALVLALTALLVLGCGDESGEGQPQTLTSTTSGSGEATDGGPSGAELPYPGDPEEVAAISAVLSALAAGEPSPYEEDGTTFQNREGLLPGQPLGYYREYTVPTPGSPDRGARRLVIGAAGETYYTDDHYASFERIDPEDYR